MPRPIAPLFEDFKQKFGVPHSLIPFGSRRAAFPTDTFAINVELLIDGSWTSITDKVLSRDIMTITRGKSDEANVVDPSTATLTLNNRDGVFSPRNPMSPYYGKIGRNTALRISVGEKTRFYGEVSAWPQKWDISGNDVWVPVEVAGILRRLGQGATPLKSTLYQKLSSSSSVIAYWPAEDLANSTSVGSAVSNGNPMDLDGTPDFAVDTSFNCSDDLPQLKLSKWTGLIDTYTPASNAGGSTGFRWRFLLLIPSGGAPDNTIVAQLRSSGTESTWRVVYRTASGGELDLIVLDDGGATKLTLSGVLTGINGVATRVHVSASGITGSITATVSAVIGGSVVSVTGGYAIAGVTLGIARSVIINPSGTLDDVVIGHISVENNFGSDDDLIDELAAFAGETAAARINRLCDENNIPIKMIGTVEDTQTMGPQRIDTLLNLLTECANADAGILYEPRELLGLAYRTRTSQYNRPTTVTLDYPSHQLTNLEPIDDDRFVRNDITVSRTSGSSFRTVLESGALSVNDPPNGVGRYTEQTTLNLWKDLYLADQAGWRLHLGTVNEARYPVINLDLTNASITNNPDLLSAIQNADIGDCLMVTNPPAWLPPEAIEQSVRGSTEEINTFEWRIALNCIPCSPYDIAVYGDSDSRYSPSDSSLAVAVDSTTTSLSVATNSGVVWTTSAAEFPFDIMVGGERMTITNIAGASSPQTFTVTRSVNGIVKAQNYGTDVELFSPVYYGF